MSGRWPEVTVIIPTHNRSATVVRAVRSVLDARIDELEVVVVDDASDDGTDELLKGLADPRVCVHRLTRRSGAPMARNLGIDVARGGYLAFLDSDDTMLPGRLQRQIGAMRSTPGAVGSTGGFLVVGKGPTRHGFSTLGSKDQVGRLLRLRHGSLTSSVITVSAEAARATKWDGDLPALQDYDFLLRLAMRGRVATVRQMLARKERSDSRIYHGDKVVRARAMVLEKYRARLELDPIAMRRHCRALLRAVDAHGGDSARAGSVSDTVALAGGYLSHHDSKVRSLIDSVTLERMLGRVADLVGRP